MKKIELIGNVGNVEQGEKSLNVTFCVNSSKKNENGEWENVEWWCSAIFHKDANIQKGDRMFLRGDFNVDIYLNKEGIPAYRLVVFVKEYDLLMRKKS